MITKEDDQSLIGNTLFVKKAKHLLDPLIIVALSIRVVRKLLDLLSRAQGNRRFVGRHQGRDSFERISGNLLVRVRVLEAIPKRAVLLDGKDIVSGAFEEEHDHMLHGNILELTAELLQQRLVKIRDLGRIRGGRVVHLV
ncbi:hypothetical protein HG531_009335 [Fusarium graminearum]|nr:hypothetical protein HG531_009335 [Fusarium graminearum]